MNNGYYTYNRRQVSRIALMNTIIIAINVIVFIIMEFLGDTESAYFMFKCGAMEVEAVVEQREYWRLFTSIFMHFGFSHLFNNMLVLAFLGDNLERALGKFKYLIVYLGSGVLANIVSVLSEYYNGTTYVSAGASGAIFGVVGGLIVILYAHRGWYEDLSLQRVGFFALMSIYLGFQNSHTNNIAHLGGIFFGIILCMILYRKTEN